MTRRPAKDDRCEKKYEEKDVRSDEIHVQFVLRAGSRLVGHQAIVHFSLKVFTPYLSPVFCSRINSSEIMHQQTNDLDPMDSISMIHFRTSSPASLNRASAT